MTFMAVGWAVVHSLWQCTLIAGVTAMILALLPDRRTPTRYAVACAALAVMVGVPIVTAVIGPVSIGMRLRMAIVYGIDRAVGFPDVVPWALIIIPAAGAIWCAGLAVCIVRLAAEGRRVARLRNGTSGDPGDAVRAMVGRLRAQMALARDVEVRSSTRAHVPMVLGWRRAVILLPPPALEALTPDQLRTVLAHELAHVRRGDFVGNLLQVVAEMLLFHHPAAAWISRRIRTEREYCCDDVAVAISGDVRLYAGALAALEDARADSRLMVAAASGTLLDRIQRIAGHPRRVLTPRRGALVLAAAVVVAAALLATALSVPPVLRPGMKLRRPAPTSVGD